MSPDVDMAVEAAARAIESADALLIGAGAGMGVDSGLPDFRGNEGFWKSYPPLKKLGLSFVNLANPHWFRSDPELAWGFYGHRQALYRTTRPHAGFAILRKWAGRLPGGSFVFTSNVDTHFQKAGFDEEQIVECHGSLEFLQCAGGCSRAIWPAPEQSLAIDETSFRARSSLPQCARCGALARPNVLMFGDGEWLEERTEAQYARYAKWRRENRNSGMAVVELGAGTAVPTVRLECESAPGTLIRINPREPWVANCGIALPLSALESLLRIDARIEGAS